MSDDDARTTVEAKRDIAERLLTLAGEPRYEGGQPRVPTLADDDDLRAFLERAFEEMAVHLADNRATAESRGFSGSELRDYEAVDDLLEQLDDIDVRGNGWHDPVVRLWFTGDVPVWANDAWTGSFRYSVDREHYNGDRAHAKFDSRKV